MTSPIDIEAGASGITDADRVVDVPRGVSINFDGTADFMGDATERLHGFGNLFTISTWVNPDSIASQRYIYNMVKASMAPDDQHRIDLRMGAAGRLDFLLFDGSSAIRKNYQWNSVFSVGTWTHIFVCWDGGAIGMFIDSVLTAPSATPTDLAITVAATARQTWIGRLRTSQHWDGLIQQVALWDQDIGSAASDVYNGGDSTFDLSADSGSYNFSSDLQHWWLLGKDQDDIGKDFGIGSPLIDANVSGNIVAADIVGDVA